MTTDTKTISKLNKQISALTGKINALEDSSDKIKAEQDKCIYCHEPTPLMPIHAPTDNGLNECYIHECADGTALFLTVDGIFSGFVDMNYCLMCGRNLNAKP